MIDPETEAALQDLAAKIVWPPPVDFAGRLRLEQPAPTPRRALTWVVGVLAVVLLISLLPAGRRAVANLLEVAGIRLEFANPPEAALPSTIQLGERSDLESAQSAVDFRVLTPAALDPPSSIHVREWPLGTQVFLAWSASDRLPEVGNSGVGLLLAEFRANLDGFLITKLLQEGTTIDRVTVGGAEGFWLAGAPHVFMFETGEGDMVEDSTRLAGNVLIWDSEGVTYRLESNLDFAQTLAIAESLEPES